MIAEKRKLFFSFLSFDILLVAYDYIGADDNSSGNEQDSDNACS